jgi:hypothetical protein
MACTVSCCWWSRREVDHYIFQITAYTFHWNDVRFIKLHSHYIYMYKIQFLLPGMSCVCVCTSLPCVHVVYVIRTLLCVQITICTIYFYFSIFKFIIFEWVPGYLPWEGTGTLHVIRFYVRYTYDLHVPAFIRDTFIICVPVPRFQNLYLDVSDVISIALF